MMSDKQYLSEKILNTILQKLDELKQTSEKPFELNLDSLNRLLEQSQQQA